MAEPENLDDEFFDDLYNDDEPAPASVSESTIAEASVVNNSAPTVPDVTLGHHTSNGIDEYVPTQNGDERHGEEDGEDELDLYVGTNNGTMPNIVESITQEDSPAPSTPSGTVLPSFPPASMLSLGTNDKSSISKEDGKMFIGGLNWETTDQSLRAYFSQFGEVVECTVMRDNSTGRSRGFGFLTFKDPKTVNIVMVKEHHLDGKIIDPKRAIPRDEQEKTSKIFVGGVSQETTDAEFKEYFAQFGRVVDATLMMDKDTGRPRGFGFVTFESEAGVDACLSTELAIHGKPIEVKKAQPRGNIRDEEESSRRGGKFGKHNKFGGGRDSASNNGDMGSDQGMGGGQNGNNNGNNSMTPQAMAQMFQRMQQMMQVQQMMMGRGGQGMGMGQMNPMMAQQMMQMQMMGRGQGGPNSPMMGGMGGPMNPAMIQQMQQMQQQMQQQQMMGSQGSNQGQGAGRPGFSAYEQQMFEQQKYEQQHQHRQRDQGYGNNMQSGYNDQGWDGGMYDDGSQGSMNQGGRQFRQNRQMNDPNNAPPANAPTGPKNQGKPGANMYRGGARGGGTRFHPYSR